MEKRSRAQLSRRALRAPFEDEAFVVTHSDVYGCHTLNLSRSGMLLQPRRPIRRGVRTRVIFELPQRPGDPGASPWLLSFEVARARLDRHTGACGMAFLAVPPDVAKDIERYLFESTFEQLCRAIGNPQARQTPSSSEVDSELLDEIEVGSRQLRDLYRAALSQVARAQDSSRRLLP